MVRNKFDYDIVSTVFILEYDSLVELRRYRREMLKRFELSKHKFSEIAKMKSKEYRACDPSFYKEGINKDTGYDIFSFLSCYRDKL